MPQGCVQGNRGAGERKQCYDQAYVMTQVDTQQVSVGCNGGEDDQSVGKLQPRSALSLSVRSARYRIKQLSLQMGRA